MRNSTSIHYNEVNEVMNCKMAITKNLKPGMGATMYCGSDRYPMVVTEVLSPKKIMVAHVLDAHEDKFTTDKNRVQMLPQEYLDKYKEFKPDEYGYCGFHVPQEYSYRKNGRWMPKGKGMWETCSIHIGCADSYRDPNY